MSFNFVRTAASLFRFLSSVRADGLSLSFLSRFYLTLVILSFLRVIVTCAFEIPFFTWHAFFFLFSFFTRCNDLWREIPYLPAVACCRVADPYSWVAFIFCFSSFSLDWNGLALGVRGYYNSPCPVYGGRLRRLPLKFHNEGKTSGSENRKTSGEFGLRCCCK